MTHWLLNHQITGHIVFVLVSVEWVMMCPVIDNPTSCEIRARICFLHVKNTSAVEIHRGLCAVYGQNVMSEGTVRQWCRMFKDGQINVHDEQRNVRPPVEGDYLCSNSWPKICEIRRFTILEFSCESPEFSRTLLYEIITVRLGYHKFCARWLPKCSRARTKRR
jgi:hypothetical protein